MRASCGPMVAGIMRRLRRGQSATLELDGEGAPVACRVGGVAGTNASLQSADELDLRQHERLVAGSLGYLFFQHQGRPIALRGAAIVTAESEPLIEFAVVDGVTLPERRTAERIPCRLPARVDVLEPHASQALSAEVEALDLSLGGALLAWPDAPPVGHRLHLELDAGGAGSALQAEARIARLMRGRVGIAFEGLDGDGRTRLASVLGRLRIRRSWLSLSRAGLG